MGYAQFLSRSSAGDLAFVPCGHDGFVILASVLKLPSKVNPFGFGGGNPFGLSLVVEFPFRLSDIAQKWSTILAISTPVRSRPWRVSSRGISSTTMATCLSLVNNRHCSKISL